MALSHQGPTLGELTRKHLVTEGFFVTEGEKGPLTRLVHKFRFKANLPRFRKSPKVMRVEFHLPSHFLNKEIKTEETLHYSSQ